MKNKGFTLTELMITLVILVIAGGPVIYMFINSSKGVNAESKYLQAMFLTQGLVEKYFEKVYDNPKETLDEEGSFDPPFDKFQYETKYEPIENEKLLYKVTVRTFWKNGIKTVSYPLSFYISKKYYYQVEEAVTTAFDEEYGEVGY